MSGGHERAAAILRRVSKGSRGVEVGVWRGELSHHLLSAGIKLIMVDNWLPGEMQRERYKATKDYHTKVTEHAVNRAFSAATEVVRKFPDRARIIKEDSHIAAGVFTNESLDFVFLDADHSYEGVKQDIKDWLPKVKSGGWICGHDYGNKSDGINNEWVFGVKPAVDEFVQGSGLELELDVNFTWFVRV